MKQNIYLGSFIILIIFLSKFEAKTQDIHYSQFYNSPLNINPALTGIFNGDVRIMGSLRDQWRSVPVPYTTFSGGYDMKYLPKKSDKYFLGFGGIFNYDQAGDSKLTITDLNLSGSYTYLLNKKNLLTAGLMLGVASEGFTPGGLTWSTQWTGAAFDPNLGSQEGFDRKERFSYLETGVGINYRFQADSSRTYANIGAGFFHLNQPVSSFIDLGDPNLPLRTSLNAVINIQVAKPVDIQIHGLAQFQGPYSEMVFGGLAKFHLSQKPGKQFRIDAGAQYRTSGSIAPTLAFKYNGYYLGLSYDINLSPFNDQFNRKSGPEVHFRYIITNVKAINHKPCPVY